MSPGLFGLLIIVVTMVARGGVVGVVSGLLYRLAGQSPSLKNGDHDLGGNGEKGQ